MRVDATSNSDAVGRILDWANGGESRYVCCGNVHSVMEAFDSTEFRVIMNSADLVTSDGAPVVWALRQLGVRSATRVPGAHLLPAVFRAADRAGFQVGFYGGNIEALKDATDTAMREYPGLVGYHFSPPSGGLSPDEDRMVVDRINASGIQILLVGLGCPEQEKWMAAHKGRVQSVMLGAGASFDHLTGIKTCAGLNWPSCQFLAASCLRHYNWQNSPRFLAHFAAQLMALKHS